MNLNYGVFVVSLDFELYWGIRDKQSTEQYGSNLRGVRKAVPEILRLFSDNGIHATWATVGFLFFKNVAELRRSLPKTLPKYIKQDLSPYTYIKNTVDLDPTYHFAPELIDLIKEHDGQEIGTHTFSHYYCLEDGQSLTDFEEDIAVAVQIAKNRGISIKSLVFPRNQWNREYLNTIGQLGIQCYRGNESSWIYKASDDGSQGKFQRALRLIDTYINLSGYNTYRLEDCTKEKPYNFPSSRFLRPYSNKLTMLDGLRLKRVTSAMNNAARHKRIFHLWWHPHNFGINTDHNIEFLTKIIEYYTFLKKTFAMRSLNMGELCHLS